MLLLGLELGWPRCVAVAFANGLCTICDSISIEHYMNQSLDVNLTFRKQGSDLSKIKDECLHPMGIEPGSLGCRSEAQAAVLQSDSCYDPDLMEDEAYMES